jgi:DNA-binding transcriptional ArsR family regulator
VERTTHVLDAGSLKALAHPVRVQLLGLLRVEGPSTATALGARLGESSGTTSYHLRQLAAVDLVVEDETRGNARERWWRAAQDSSRLEPADWLDDPDVKPALDAYLSAILTTYAAKAQAFLNEAATWPRRWVRAAEMSDYGLSLNAAELTRLNAAVNELVESYRREPRKGDDQVVFQFQSFPRRTP